MSFCVIQLICYYTYFDAQIFPNLTSGNLFKVVSLSFLYVPVIFLSPYFWNYSIIFNSWKNIDCITIYVS